MTTIRLATVDDVDTVGEVHVRAWQSAYRGLMPDDYLDGLRPQDPAERWREHLEGPPSDGLLFVLDEQGVVGFGSIGPAHDADLSAGTGQLYAINLDPALWGRGLGRGFLDELTDRLGEPSV